MVRERVMHVFGTADSDSLLANQRHITWMKPWPGPKTSASFGFWRPVARAQILLGRA